MNKLHLSRRDLLKSGALTVLAATQTVSASQQSAAPADSRSNLATTTSGISPVCKRPSFEARACFENLHFFTYLRGREADIELWRDKGTNFFWNREDWNKKFTAISEMGFNIVIYGGFKNNWQSFLIRNKAYPEARYIPDDLQEETIAQAEWIFNTARTYGLKNLINNFQIVTTPTFAQAHGFDKLLPESETVAYNHNSEIKDSQGPQYGIRNELTRAYTTESIVELLTIYKTLDGFYGEMGEAVPGKRSTWFKEAVVPGLIRNGRNPIYVLLNWMLPREDFISDIISGEVYPYLWLSVMPNGEMYTDAEPYPNYRKWINTCSVPVIMGVHVHNVNKDFPFNSPKIAHEMVAEFKKFDNCIGFSSQTRSNPMHDLCNRAMCHYGKNLDLAYSDDPWIKVLEAEYGNREAALHILNAFDHSARIVPELCAQIWHATDALQGRHLGLRYFYFTDYDARFTGWYTSPSRGTELMPIRRYAQIVAQNGERHRSNGGEDYSKPPFNQASLFGTSDYQVVPEVQMLKIRKLGELAFTEMESGFSKAAKNKNSAEVLLNYMKASKLLTDYYEKKVLAAISALIFAYGSKARKPDFEKDIFLNLRSPEPVNLPLEKERAEQLADDTLKLYETANTFMWEVIDKKTNKMTEAWDGRALTLPELMELERKERTQLAQRFEWPDK